MSQLLCGYFWSIVLRTWLVHSPKMVSVTFGVFYLKVVAHFSCASVPSFLSTVVLCLGIISL